MRTLAGSTPAGGLAHPAGFGCVLYKIGEVLPGFQKEEEEGFGHALIKGHFLGTEAWREMEEGGTVHGRGLVQLGEDPWPRNCMRGRGERKT